jgi:hypothetical protein
MKRTTSKSSSKISNKKTKTIFNPKSDVIFQDNSGINSKFQMIFDNKEPIYKHIQEKQ